MTAAVRQEHSVHLGLDFVEGLLGRASRRMGFFWARCASGEGGVNADEDSVRDAEPSPSAVGRKSRPRATWCVA